MADKTGISWSDATWNPIIGCTKVSPGCDHCYPIPLARIREKNPNPKVADAFAGVVQQTENGLDWTGRVNLLSDRLDQPLKWRKPRRVFVNSLADLFHDQVPDDFIAKVFAIMAVAKQHTFQILTKRHARMRSLLNSSRFVGEVQRQVDVLRVQRAILAMGEERVLPVPGFPGYLVSDRGHVYTTRGSDVCVWCQGELPATSDARRRYCSSPCRAKAAYEKQMGRWEEPAETRRLMSLEAGEQGHRRVTLYRESQGRRELVHRLVLTAFDRAPEDGEQGCHVDGDPSNNHLPNLRWGTQEDNWEDRKRHGNGQSHSKLTEDDAKAIRGRVVAGASVMEIADDFGISDTQVKNIIEQRQWKGPSLGDFQWPLPGVWLGVSVENQKWADIRIPALLDTPAAVHWISAEPLLGPIDLAGQLDATGYHRPKLTYWLTGRPSWGNEHTTSTGLTMTEPVTGPRLDWVVTGGESGPGARPMHPKWVKDLRDQCQQAGVAYHFKQWGEWRPQPRYSTDDRHHVVMLNGTDRGTPWPGWGLDQPEAEVMERVGKKRAGRELDGRTWDEFPDTKTLEVASHG